MQMLAACHHDHGESREPVPAIDSTLAESRTILAYIVAENSLNSYVREDLNEMLAGMGDKTLLPGNKLLVYVDDVKMPRIYCITKDNQEANINEIKPEVTYDEDCNSASADKLGEVIDYMLEHHPADSYGLVMWSHASGWVPSTYSGDYAAPKRSFGIDNGKNTSSGKNCNTGNQMDIAEMAQAIEARCQFEFILFDACFMQCIEVDYELRHCARFIIGSPAEIPGPGADYSVLMKPMFEAKDYAQHMVETYYSTYYDDEGHTYKNIISNGFVDTYGVIISAVKTDALEPFAAYMQMVCAEHGNELCSIVPESVLRYDHTQRPDFMDIQGIMSRALNEAEYAKWQGEFAKTVAMNMFTPKWYSNFSGWNNVIPEQCGGVSMFVPIKSLYKQNNSTGYPAKVKTLEWGRMMWEQAYAQ